MTEGRGNKNLDPAGWVGWGRKTFSKFSSMQGKTLNCIRSSEMAREQSATWSNMEEEATIENYFPHIEAESIENSKCMP